MKKLAVEKYKPRVLDELNKLLIMLKWILTGIVCGGVIGGLSTIFGYTIQFVTDFRLSHPYMVCFLPLAGVIIVLVYHLSGVKKPQGTNIVIASIHSGEHLPSRMAPLIFVATVLTHLCGGSAGREGAALQFGGSLAASFGRLIHADRKDMNIIIMCGMSAAFSAVFGTPVASALFSMEIVSIGIMQYSALVPCVAASVTASLFAHTMGFAPESMGKIAVPALSVITASKTVLLALLCAFLSVAFCVMMQRTGGLFEKLFKGNQYLAIVSAGIIIAALSFIPGFDDYLGAGVPVIVAATKGNAVWYAFIIKMIFTAITIGAGYKGGEIVPAFFIGSTFGCFFGHLLGLPPSLSAACGMIALFCGVTNCPVTSLLISFELFGFGGVSYYLISVAISYMMSGYYGIYKAQRIMYSKYRPEFVNRTVRVSK